MRTASRHCDDASGFTLVELIIVITILAIVMVIGLPKLLAARLTANENSAISTLRTLSTAQVQIMTLGSIDTDADGAGEGGYLAELAGSAAARASAGGLPAPGVFPLNPTLLSAAFGIVDANGLVARSGYYFQIWLPDGAVGGLTSGIAELPTVGGADPLNFPDPDGSEVLWCCYAWPVVARQSGNRAFFINQTGELMQFKNDGAAPYSSVGKMPAFDEAFMTAGDMGSLVRVGIAGGSDNTLWTPVQ